MYVKELKEFLEGVPDNYIVMIEAHRNNICKEFDNSHILSEATVLDMYNDIEFQSHSYTDENGELQNITSKRHLGGTLTLSNNEKGLF